MATAKITKADLLARIDQLTLENDELRGRLDCLYGEIVWTAEDGVMPDGGRFTTPAVDMIKRNAGNASTRADRNRDRSIRDLIVSIRQRVAAGYPIDYTRR